MDKNLIAKFGQMPPTPPPTPPPTLPPSEEARPDEGQLSLPGSEGVAGASGLKLVAPPPPPSPKKKAKKAATPVAVATSGGIAAELLTLQQQLSAAELEHAAVVAKIAALIGAA